MADRSFDRIFAEAAAAVESFQEANDPETEKRAKSKTQEEQLRATTANMTVSDAIKRILLAHKDRDYFRRVSELSASRC